MSYATHATSAIFQRSPRLRFDGNIILRSSSPFKPVSCRDGLLVLWRNPEVHVCNTFTGRVDTLPCIDDAKQRKLGNGGIYPPALLAAAARVTRSSCS